MNNFQITALEENEFSELFNLDAIALQKMGAVKMIVDRKPGFPCRISLEDAEIGEEVILLPYLYHASGSPYQATGPIFVRRSSKTAKLQVNEIPKMLEHRLLSVRAYDDNGMMKQALVMEGSGLRHALHEIFEKPEISYIHIHNAKPGCYNCRVERA